MPRFRVGPATPDEHPAAARALFARRAVPAADALAARCRSMLAAGELDPAGLFVARAGGAVVAAGLVQALPGALGLAWPVRAESPAVEDAVVAAGCAWLRARGVRVCQAFLTTDERADAASLERNGFRRVTELLHLRRPVAAEPDAALWDPARSPLAFRPYRPADPGAFAAVLLGTYEGTLDAPELNAARAGADVLHGFRGPWGLIPDWWQLATARGGGPAGVVLGEPGAGPRVWEVSYLGLLPAARGRGWGGELVRFAVARAAQDGMAAVTLSVDARNAPARRLYDRHGFAEQDRKDVYLAAW